MKTVCWASIVPQQVKLLPTVPASCIGAVSSPGCSTLYPANGVGKATEDGSRVQVLVNHLQDLEETSGSWLRPGSAMTAVPVGQ